MGKILGRRETSGHLSASCQVSFLVPAHHCPAQLKENVPRIDAFLRGEYGGAYEVILIPNPVLEDHSTLLAARQLSRHYPRVKVCPTSILPGKGLALKEGFGMARGEWIFTTDADMPYDLRFFKEASKMLGLGFQLVLGNRRLPASKFRMTKRVLSKIYPRVLIGLFFNLVVRCLFPIHTRDTQAGIKAMTREAANQIFRHQVCPKFSYDIEMVLTAQGLGYRIAELPVTLYLKSEESTVQIFKTGLHAAYWISRIAWRHWKGLYEKPIPT